MIVIFYGEVDFSSFSVEWTRTYYFWFLMAPFPILCLLAGIKNLNVITLNDVCSLKPHARELLKSFGFNGDLINMRTALYFVGKKGMKMTPVQRVNQPEKAGQWPTAINERFCLPSECE